MLGVLLALLAAGQAGKPAAAPPASPQQRFDAASDMATQPGGCREAVRLFEALERDGGRRNPLVAAAIDVRKGRCLIAIERTAEGEAAIRRGLPALVAKGESFAPDVRNGQIMLGEAARLRFDYDAAVRDYTAALDGATGGNRIMPLMLLARTTMFDHDGRALRYAEEARRIVAETPAIDKRNVAKVQTEYARVLLNEGRDKEAYAVLRDSLAKQGGLDLKVTLDDIATRSDLAIAALRTRDVEGARKYLAYTGAGRLKDAPFARAVSMNPPACDPAAGLTRDDVAVVEFTLEEDGHVGSVTPIFTTGRRAAAIAFGRAVADWSWRAEDAKAVPLLFRIGTRVELRCIAAGDAPAITNPLRDKALDWFRQAGARPIEPDVSDARVYSTQKAALQQAEASGTPADVLLASLGLLFNPVTDPKERDALLERLPAKAAAAKAPATVRALIASLSPQPESASAYRERLRGTLREPDVAAEPIAAATLRLLIASPLYKSASPPDALALTDAVIAEPALPARHPLKTAALLQRANLLAARNDLAGAQAAFRETGLSAEQCALVGLQPALRRTGASGTDFPMEAMRWGFEGWVRTEFDVTADGRTAAQRAVVAYPPFVFDDAAVGVARDARVTGTYRPEGALACSGKQQSIQFRLP